MNENELFCFCGTCICGNKEMFIGKREVKQYFIMPRAPLICYSLTPFSTYLTLHTLANCIMLLTHIELVPLPGIFTQNVQSWVKGIFMSFWDNLISF
jgi:hypothetical protein